MTFPYSRIVNAGTQNVSVSDVNILCDTSSGAINLILPKISDIINFNSRSGFNLGGSIFNLTVTDISNNASVNNITINTNSGEIFSNNISNLVINQNNGNVTVKPISDTLWNANFTYTTSGGGGGNDKNFVYQQITNASSWVVNHNLDKRCAVQIVDNDFQEIIGNITWLNNNTVKVEFNSAITGYVYCN